MSKEKGNVMTPEEINRKIAELCGWKFIIGDYVSWDKVIEREGGRVAAWRNPQGVCYEPADRIIPDYYHSLDACAEFERTLTDTRQMEAYVFYIKQSFGILDNVYNVEFCLTTLTAPQRCEAFLRMHNKWRE